MRAARMWTAVASILALAGAAQAAPSVEIREAAARVVVVPEARSDVEVVIARANPALPLSIRKEDGRVVVSGDLGGRLRWLGFGFGMWCGGSGHHDRVRVHGRWMDVDALPQVIVRTPLDAEVAAVGVVFGAVGRSDSLILSNTGCGDWTVANVKGPLTVNEAGSGDVRAGSTGGLPVHSAGSGAIYAQAVTGPMDVKIAGSGDVVASSLTGPLDVFTAGSGDVRIAAGEISTMAVHIAGSGDVRVGRVMGPVSRHVMGSGSVEIGD